MKKVNFFGKKIVWWMTSICLHLVLTYVLALFPACKTLFLPVVSSTSLALNPCSLSFDIL